MKPLLFILFLALLGTSCGGGHITTTPVVKNAPSVSLNTSKKQNRQNSLTVPNDIACIDLGTKNWSLSTSNRAYTFLDNNVKATSGSTLGNYVCSSLDQITYDNLNSYPTDYDDVFAIRNYNGSVIFSFRSTTIVGEDTTPALIKQALDGIYLYYHMIDPSAGTTANGYFYTEGYNTGYSEGLEQGEEQGYNEGYAIGYENGLNESSRLIPNGQYTGLLIFPRRHYLENYANEVIHGRETPTNGNLDLIDTNGNYTIHIKWTYLANEQRMRFQDFGNTILGQLDWVEVSEGNWSTSWFYLYDKETHMFTQPKTYLGNGPIDTSFYPEVYLGSTFQGDPNLYFAGGGNDYQMGFADGQTYTIHASETYQNIFTIFTPAFRAVSDFFNLNIGPFKVWYFFAIPLIVTLLILVLRLVKH